MAPGPEFDTLLPAIGLTRRGFVLTTLGASFALAVQPTLAQRRSRPTAKVCSPVRCRYPVPMVSWSLS